MMMKVLAVVMTLACAALALTMTVRMAKDREAIERLTAQNETLKESNTELVAERSSLDGKCTNLANQNEKLRDEIASQKASGETMAEEIAGLVSQVGELLIENGEIIDLNDLLQIDLANLRLVETVLQQELGDVKKSFEEIVAELTQKAEALLQAKRLLSAATADAGALEERLASTADALSSALGDIQELTRQREALQVTVKVMREMIKNLQDDDE